jgi:hypothetical protein
MDIIEALQQDIRRAREAYRLERTARANGRLVSARGDLAVARALIDCISRPAVGCEHAVPAIHQPSGLSERPLVVPNWSDFFRLARARIPALIVRKFS